MKPFNNSFATLRLREEQSPYNEENVTGADGPYPASLHASKKKINPFTEDELSGYKKLKGFRPGHTKDTGGFQYSDLWDVNEEAKEYQKGSEVRITKKGDIHYNDKGEIVKVENGIYTIQFKDNTIGEYQISHITKPASETSFEDKPSLELNEDDMQEKSANQEQLEAMQKGYDNLQPSQRAFAEMRIEQLKKLVKMEKDRGKALPFLSPGTDYKAYLKKHGLNENYHRFKKETVTRSKEQQMHEAMKLVRKKLYEAETVMDYVKTMKEELGLQEYKSHTNKLMEKLQVSIGEIYKKYKSIK
jgi:hypothetical protein